MTGEGQRGAWASYWCREGAAEAGCIGESEAIRAVLLATWSQFARALPPRAAVLDLATGNGAVLAVLRAARRDLALTGVDAAPRLPRPAGGITFRAGVAIERLPFSDARFAAVTSQFGIEYADPEPAAGELARVLRSGGRCQLVVHHAESPVVRHNLARLAALRWASLDSGLLAKARAFARSRQALALPTPAAFGEAIGEARQRFPEQSVAAEFLTGVVQVLDSGRFAPAERTAALLDDLGARSADEISRLEDLARAVCDNARIEGLASALRTHGLRVDPPAELRERDAAPPFAWRVRGEKPAVSERGS